VRPPRSATSTDLSHKARVRRINTVGPPACQVLDSHFISSLYRNTRPWHGQKIPPLSFHHRVVYSRRLKACGSEWRLLIGAQLRTSVQERTYETWMLLSDRIEILMQIQRHTKSRTLIAFFGVNTGDNFNSRYFPIIIIIIIIILVSPATVTRDADS